MFLSMPMLYMYITLGTMTTISCGQSNLWCLRCVIMISRYCKWSATFSVDSTLCQKNLLYLLFVRHTHEQWHTSSSTFLGHMLVSSGRFPSPLKSLEGIRNQYHKTTAALPVLCASASMIWGEKRMSTILVCHYSCSFMYLLQDAVSLGGGVIGAMHIPEKWFPGTVDRCLNSHNIMHVLVVLAVYSMHQVPTISNYHNNKPYWWKHNAPSAPYTGHGDMDNIENGDTLFYIM